MLIKPNMRNGATLEPTPRFNETAPPGFVIPSRSKESPGKPLALMREEIRSQMVRALMNEFALRAEIFRGGSR
jgi:hypothetical protein